MELGAALGAAQVSLWGVRFSPCAGSVPLLAQWGVSPRAASGLISRACMLGRPCSAGTRASQLAGRLASGWPAGLRWHRYFLVDSALAAPRLAPCPMPCPFACVRLQAAEEAAAAEARKQRQADKKALQKERARLRRLAGEAAGVPGGWVGGWAGVLCRAGILRVGWLAYGGCGRAGRVQRWGQQYHQSQRPDPPAP